MILCAMLPSLHAVSFAHGCFTGKCILTGSTEQRYFKVDGSMEKKWDTVIPADVKRLFISETCMSPLVTKGLRGQSSLLKCSLSLLLIFSLNLM